VTYVYSYEDARATLISTLKREVAFHRAKEYGSLGESFDLVDSQLPRNSDTEFNKLFLAFNFWEGWLDACEHDWFYYEPISENDWPNYADIIISDLENNCDTQNSILIEKFAVKPPQISILSRLFDFFGNNQKT
jgi:hypothetical protein